MGNKNSSAAKLNNGFPVQLIDGNGNFNVDMVGLAKDVKLAAIGSQSFAVVSVIGEQSSGKSTILNHLFDTKFKEMDAQKGRSRTTNGIFVEKVSLPQGCFLVIDTEGFDGAEREDDMSFERQTIALTSAISDTLIINMWCTSIGLRRHDLVLRTVFEVTIGRISTQRKINLVFVLRDKTKSPLEELRRQLENRLEEIWCQIPIPQAQGRILLTDHFKIEVVPLPNYEWQEVQFKLEVATLREKIVSSSTSGEFAMRTTAASEFVQKAKVIWDDIKKNKDFNLPRYRIMEAEVLCNQFVDEKYKRFLEDESWLQIKKDIQSGAVESFGKKVNSLVATYLSQYDKETLRYNETIRDERREQLIEKLLKVIEPTYLTTLEHIRNATLENFKHADYTNDFLVQLDDKFADVAIEQANWNHTAKQRQILLHDMNVYKDRIDVSEIFDPLKLGAKQKLSWWDLAFSVVNFLSVAVPFVFSFVCPASSWLWLVRLTSALLPVIGEFIKNLSKTC